MYFLITVDTEGDNLWNWHEGQPITTENTLYIPRFQSLCEQYGFIPTYLTNYEMATDSRWIDYGGKKAHEGKCEIGMHLHGWNTPPEYPLKNIYGSNAYITEYPKEIAEAKISTMMNLLRNRFETDIISHRAGRWATSKAYFQSLSKYGIRIDCSITPGLDLSHIPGCSKNIGNDYTHEAHKVYYVADNLLEIPMTSGLVRWLPRKGSIFHKTKALLLGEPLWLRPIEGIQAMKALTINVRKKMSNTYLEFMIHSSELMPGGSPYNKSSEECECFYETIDNFFKYISEMNYKGCSLSEYSRLFCTGEL